MAQRSKFIGAPSRYEFWEPQEDYLFSRKVTARAERKTNKTASKGAGFIVYYNKVPESKA